MCKLHHVAIATNEFERYETLFRKLGMKKERENGQVPERQLWFFEGIQLKEVEKIEVGSNVDHIAISTDNIERSIEVALSNGCTLDLNRNNWFILPNGVKVELLMYEENI